MAGTGDRCGATEALKRARIALLLLIEERNASERKEREEQLTGTLVVALAGRELGAAAVDKLVTAPASAKI